MNGLPEYQLEQGTPLPYFFDVLRYEALADPDIKAHIDRIALTFYERKKHTTLPRIKPMLY